MKKRNQIKSMLLQDLLDGQETMRLDYLIQGTTLHLKVVAGLHVNNGKTNSQFIKVVGIELLHNLIDLDEE